MGRLYVDMDGVLAEWNSDASIEEVATPGYFTERKPMVNVIQVIQRMIKEAKIEVFILSSVFEDSHSANDKRVWLNKYLPEIEDNHCIFNPYSRPKEKAIPDISDDDYLLDDFSKNLHTWKGTGIKVYNGINGTKGSWNGFSIHSNMMPQFLYRQLMGIISQMEER